MPRKKQEILPPDIENEIGNNEAVPVVSEKPKAIKKKKKKTKKEYSKMLCTVAVVIFTCVAIYAIAEYYYLMYLAIQFQSDVTPDAALPIAGITSILAAVLSYCLYQGSLKASLNKNKLSVDENGIIRPIIENIIRDTPDDSDINNSDEPMG